MPNPKANTRTSSAESGSRATVHSTASTPPELSLRSLILHGSSTASLLLDDAAAKTPHLLHAVLLLLDLLAAGLLLLDEAGADLAVLGLEFLQGLQAVVDEAEASGAASTELVAETEQDDRLRVAIVDALDLGL